MATYETMSSNLSLRLRSLQVFDYKEQKIILKQLHGSNAILNGRCGVVQPYEIPGGQFEIRLLASSLELSGGGDTKCAMEAVTVYDFQIRLMKKKEATNWKAKEVRACESQRANQ